MKCKICNLELSEGQTYSCANPSACDFSPDYPNSIRELKATEISHDPSEQGCYNAGYEAAKRDILKLLL